jgi:two-component system cell cycle sensor histidine kinase/response regulator CckA
MASTTDPSDSRRVLVALGSAAGLIFAAQMLVILVASRVAPQSILAAALIAAASASILALPAVYFFTLRPIAADAAFEQPDRESSEQRLREQGRCLRTQRLEGIGLLAVGIAHDLNNVLSSIVMAVDLLKQTSTGDNQQLLDGISANTQRGADMIARVLSFARGQEGRKVDIQMRHLIREVEGIAKAAFPKNIKVHTATTPDLWKVAGDPSQLLQVLINLCINARDAMPEGGPISITARNVTAHDPAMSVDDAPGQYVMIQVNDVGTGIPQAIIGQIFDPFFTTKEAGKGTGLGLSTSLTIVKGHGGFIRVSTTPGEGAQFQVYLPALVG